MSKNSKYILNMGLAFDEEKALKKMSNLAKEGWILSEMTLFKYKFRKTEPLELKYSMDYKELKDNNEEYFDLFASSGWKHMCSYGPYHFFSASNGATPIYTDNQSYLEKYKISRKTYFKILVISIVSLLITTLLDAYVVEGSNNKFFDIVVFLVGMISVAIAVPSLMVTLAYFFRLKNIKTNH